MVFWCYVNLYPHSIGKVLVHYDSDVAPNPIANCSVYVTIKDNDTCWVYAIALTTQHDAVVVLLYCQCRFHDSKFIL